jgi:hypothetical protein
MERRCRKVEGLRACFILLVGVLGVTGHAFAQEDVDYKRYKSSRALILDNCDVLEGHTRIAIKDGYLELPTDKRLGAVKLPARFRFFGCGVETAQELLSFLPKERSERRVHTVKYLTLTI